MDLLKLIQSIEELLYELVTWMFFYPRTFWRAIRHPIAQASKIETHFAQELRQEFPGAISPPLFLLLSILIAHAIELSLHTHLGQFKSDLARKLFESDSALLIFRAVMFSLFPLLMAVGLLRHRSTVVDRETLRAPFFVQCTFAAPFAMFTSIATFVMTLDSPFAKLAGLVSWLAAVAWYLGVTQRWFRMRLQISRLRAFVIVIKRFLLAFVISFIIGALMVSADIASSFDAASAENAPCVAGANPCAK